MYQVWLDTADPNSPEFLAYLQTQGILKIREGRQWPGGLEVLYQAERHHLLVELIEDWWDQEKVLYEGIREVKMRCFYLRDIHKFPVAAVVSELIPMDEEDRKDPVIAFAVSVCNPVDYKIFNKERMRHNAEFRLRHFIEKGFVNRPFCGTVGSIKPKERIMRCLMEQTWPCGPNPKSNRIGYPRRVRDAAAQWLWSSTARNTGQAAPAKTGSEGLSECLREIARLALQAAEAVK